LKLQYVVQKRLTNTSKLGMNRTGWCRER